MSNPGFIVVHLNVGNVSSDEAEIYFNTIKENFLKSNEWDNFKAQHPHWGFMLLPTYKGDSFVEIFHDEEGVRKKMESEVVPLLSKKIPEQPLTDTPELQQEVKDYVTKKCSVVKEISKEQFDKCYQISYAYVTQKTRDNYAQAALIKKGTLIYVQFMIGHIRFMEGSTSVGEFWYEEALEQLKNWKSSLND